MDQETLEQLRDLDIAGIAVSAAIAPDGRLGRVSGVEEKIRAAVRDGSIRTVVIAAEQKVAFPSLGFAADPHNSNIYERAALRVIVSADLAEAVRMLAVVADSSAIDIIDCSAELRRHGVLVGREWLKRRLDRFLCGTDAGYFLLTGGPGVGKSAFVAEQVRANTGPTVYHFIKRQSGWDEPDAVLRSLTAQLRRKYVLPLTQAEQRASADRAFSIALDRVSGILKRSNGEKTETIFLDGLDEAFGPTGRASGVPLHQVLPDHLPDRIKIVVTSRPGQYLHWLRRRAQCLEVDLDSHSECNLDDIRAYLTEQNRDRELGLEAGFIERLVDASAGFFAAAVLYLREQPDLLDTLKAWQAEPSLVPQGMTGWLADEWERMVSSAQARGLPQRAVHCVLGLLALCREPLSREELVAILTEVMRRAPANGERTPAIGVLPVAYFAPHLDDVLHGTEGLLDPVGAADGNNARHRFFHDRFSDYVIDQLSPQECGDCHRVLAHGCAGCLPNSPVRNYALLYLPQHYLTAGEPEDVRSAVAVLSDKAFVDARLAAGLVYEMAHDLRQATETGQDVGPICSSLVDSMGGQRLEEAWVEREWKAEIPWLRLRNALRQAFGEYPAWPQDLRRCLLGSSSFNVLLFLGETLDSSNHADQAETAFEHLLDVVDRSNLASYATALVKLAIARHHLDRYEEALEDLGKIIDSEDAESRYGEHYWWALYQKGVVLRRMGRYDEAAAALQSVRENSPRTGNATSALHQLGVIDTKCDRLPAAEQKFMKCLEERSQDPWNHRRAYDYHRLGIVYAQTGRPEEARLAFQTAKDISIACGDLRYAEEVHGDERTYL